jgi:hypothetical protein
MKTAHTIPWEAVVEGCPPSQARRLPLVVAKGSSHWTAHTCVHGLDRMMDGALNKPLAMRSGSGASSLVELFLPKYEFMAVITSDGLSAAQLQAITIPWSSRGPWDQNLGRDSFARTYVARYARLDGDVCAFVGNETSSPQSVDTMMPMEFLSPQFWGFSRTHHGLHWKAEGLFECDSQSTSSPSPSTLTRPRYFDPFDPPVPKRPDAFQCTKQLKQVRDLCERQFRLDPDELSAQNLCHHLALNLGRCRLFGVPLQASDDFTLSSRAFILAADGMIDVLVDQTRRATEVSQSLDQSRAYLIRNLALELLEIRMDAHATYLALDEAYAAATYECEPAADMMGRRLNQVRRVINLFDGNLKKQIPLLRLAASTFLLENWRRLLAPAYRDLPPWWLDGCLE